MPYLEKVETLATKIQDAEVAGLEAGKTEVSYIIVYDRKDVGGQDVIHELMTRLEAAMITSTTFGFITTLTPSELFAILESEVKSGYQHFWILSVTSPFDGVGTDEAHDWLWAMPDAL